MWNRLGKLSFCLKQKFSDCFKVVTDAFEVYFLTHRKNIIMLHCKASLDYYMKKTIGNKDKTCFHMYHRIFRTHIHETNFCFPSQIWWLI